MIAIACDHGGLELKRKVAGYFADKGVEYMDFGTDSFDSCDYPDMAEAACRAVASGKCSAGVLICSSGVGMSIAANKISGVRAALCNDLYTAEFSRRHNDANVLALGGKIIGEALAFAIIGRWLGTEFEGGRHARRVEKITRLESREN